ncbi:hypothetical protein Tco_0699688, partial [Tanacetum coccineum]
DQVDFEVGDFMWAVLTKDRFAVGENNKLSTNKIGPLEIIEKIDSNAYRLKLPSHIRCFDVFNVKHLLPYHDDSSDDDLVVNSRANFVHPRGNDAGPSVEEQALLFMEAQDRVTKKPFFSKWYNLGSETPFQTQDQPIRSLERERRVDYQTIMTNSEHPSPPPTHKVLGFALINLFRRVEEKVRKIQDLTMESAVIHSSVGGVDVEASVTAFLQSIIATLHA